MKSMKNILIVLLAVVIIAATSLVAFLGLGENQHVGINNINLGLDLAGGVSITYQAQDANPTGDQMDGALAIINSRLSTLGYTEAQAYIEGGNRIRVEIPGVSDANEAVRQIGKTAMLSFVGLSWSELVSSGITAKYSDEAAEILKKSMDKQGIAYTDASIAAQVTQYMGSAGSCNNYLPEICAKIVSEALAQGKAELVLQGEDVANATAQHGQTSAAGFVEDYVKLELTSDGAKKFADATKKYTGKYIAIRLDEQICSIPQVNTTISDGTAIITGMDDIDEAKLLASDIRGGALPVQLEDIEHNSVGATLGKDALSSSMVAAVIGFILIILFMIVVYRVPGAVASLSLIFYISAELLLLNILNITLTLPGIAGIILSIGMAVDANIVIFARINEEIRSGRAIRAAVSTGFRKALPAIIDGNVTTLLSAAVLWFLGSGPVQGFAVTLALGIVLSMFTALVLSNVLLKTVVGMLPENVALYEALQMAPKEKVLSIVKNTKLWFTIPGVIVAIGLCFFVFRGMNLDTDFAGGTMLQINMEKDYNNTELTGIVKDVSGDTNPTIQAVSGAGQDHYVSIKVKQLTTEKADEMYETIADKFGLDKETKANLISLTSISPTISSEMSRTAVTAILVASILMLIYITIRFRDVRFGLSSIAALIHDVLIVMAMYAIFYIPVNSNFIAALLTIVGYSINNTIIVFDRVRENKRFFRLDQYGELVDQSITQTMGRSISTSITTIIMVAMLFILGVESIRWFSFPLLAGFVAGTFSSICFAGPLWNILEKVGRKTVVRQSQQMKKKK